MGAHPALRRARLDKGFPAVGFAELHDGTRVQLWGIQSRSRRWSPSGSPRSSSSELNERLAAERARLPPMSTTFVTGGSGFIGGRLIERLVRDGHQRARARPLGSLGGRCARWAPQPVRGDLGDVASLTEAASGAELAFHAAAEVAEWGQLGRLRARERDRDRERPARPAARPASARFVHVGTESALMHGQPLVRVNETYPLAPDSKAPYAATKAQAEQAVLAGGARRPGDRGAAPATGLGQRRHDAAAGDRRGGEGRQVGVDRRRRAI